MRQNKGFVLKEIETDEVIKVTGDNAMSVFDLNP